MHTLDAIAAALLDRLAWSSLQAVVLIALIAAVIRLRPQLPAAARSLLWWLVGLQLLVGLVWHAPVPLRWLAAPATASAPVRTSLADTTVTVQGLPLIHTAPVAAPLLDDTLVETTRSHWQVGLLALWLVGLAMLLARAVRQGRDARSWRRDSTPTADTALLALCARRARELGLRRCPPLRVCARIESPQVTGLLRPMILLPTDHALSADETAMALDHELTHLRRGDLWMAWVPALAQRLFFFHPLVAWAMREYALHREAACDAQVLRQSGSAPQAYGRLLLRLGVSHPLHAGLAGASPTFENLKRRLTMLQQIEPSSRVRGWLLVALVAAVGVVPYRVTTAATSSVNPTPRVEAHASPVVDPQPQVAPAPAAEPASAPHIATTPRVPPTPPTPPTPPLSVTPPPPPTPPAPPAPPTSMFGSLASGHSHTHIDIDTDDNARNGFVLFDGDTVLMSGTTGDIAAARRLHTTSAPMLWFRRGDKAYVTHDSTLLARAKTIYAPVNALAREQGKLGGKQGALGGRQGALGNQQGALGQQQAELAEQEAALQGQRDADQRRAALEARQQALEQRQAALGKQQEVLGRQQEMLGRQQEALGRQQQQASEKASRQMSELIDEALAKGEAQAVPVR